MAAIVWLTSKVAAVAAGKAQGKKILLLGGDGNCSRTTGMKDNVCEYNTPPFPIKDMIEAHFIPWYGDDKGNIYNADWGSYVNGWMPVPGVGFYFPLLCVIDPNDADHYLDRTQNVPKTYQEFYDRLKKYTPENAKLYFPHTAIIDGWQTEICVLNTSNQPSIGSLKLYNEKGVLTGEKPLTLPAFGRKQISVNTEFTGIVVDYAVFNTESVSAQGYTRFWRPGEYGSALAAISEGKTFGVFAKIEKEGGWTGIAFINTEGAPASVTLTAYTDAGIAVATKVIAVGSNGKVVNTIEKLFTQNISKATYVTYLSDQKVAGFELLGSADNKMLDGFNAL
jgi:hypothetical protein